MMIITVIVFSIETRDYARGCIYSIILLIRTVIPGGCPHVSHEETRVYRVCYLLKVTLHTYLVIIDLLGFEQKKPDFKTDMDFLHPELKFFEMLIFGQFL